MPNRNEVTIVGHLTKDPDVRTSAKGNEWCMFTVAVNEGQGDKKRTDYIRVKAFNKVTHSLQAGGKIGSAVLIEGKSRSGSYEKNGVKVYEQYIEAEFIEVLHKKQEDSEPPEGQDNSQEPPKDGDIPF